MPAFIKEKFSPGHRNCIKELRRISCELAPGHLQMSFSVPSPSMKARVKFFQHLGQGGHRTGAGMMADHSN